jgi:hypothetical protein
MPRKDARSRLRSGAFGGFLRKIKIPAKISQDTITLKKTKVGMG